MGRLFQVCGPATDMSERAMIIDAMPDMSKRIIYYVSMIIKAMPHHIRLSDVSRRQFDSRLKTWLFSCAYA